MVIPSAGGEGVAGGTGAGPLADGATEGETDGTPEEDGTDDGGPPEEVGAGGPDAQAARVRPAPTTSRQRRAYMSIRTLPADVVRVQLPGAQGRVPQFRPVAVEQHLEGLAGRPGP